MVKPTLMAVDDDATALRAIEQELRKRYGDDYEIRCERSAAAALRQLEALQATESDVAMLLADLWMPEMTGIEFLARAHDLHPLAKRALLSHAEDRSCVEQILQAMALGRIDCFLAKPWRSPDEAFHKVITEFLEAWTRRHRPVEWVRVVGERWAPRSHELRDLFERNGISYGFYDLNSEEGQALLEQVQRSSGPFPVLILANGRVLTDPPNAELAKALGASTHPEEQVYDVTISGLGRPGCPRQCMVPRRGCVHW